MNIHFGCSSLKPGHVTFLNNFPFFRHNSLHKKAKSITFVT